MNLATCQINFSNLLAEEISGFDAKANYCFFEKSIQYEKLALPHIIGLNINKINGKSVNEIASKIFDTFYNSISGIKLEKLSIVFEEDKSINGLSKRVNSVRERFNEIFKKRMSALSKKVIESEIGTNQGVFVFFTDFDCCYFSNSFYYNGQKRMAFDNKSPSRSYLKVEEAYRILKREPEEGEIVVDLGASPGGWSYSATKRGAIVYAIDNGPMKNGALNNDKIIHLKEDAFKWSIDKCDWLFCDIVEEPHHVAKMIERWLSKKICSYYIVNLKFGFVKPLELKKEIENGLGGFQKNSSFYKIIHLYHDRDEWTIVGKL